MKIQIGNIETDNIALGPMAGVTDLPFRLLCKEKGCGWLTTEMVSAKAIYYKNRNTAPLLETRPEEAPLAVQLFGSEPDLMADIGQMLAEGPYAAIDVNMGCPVPKIVKNGEGSALMRDPKKAEAILTAMCKKIKKPVTVKFRKAFSDTEGDAAEFARMAESAGCAAVAVHARTREQYYSGKADWEVIRRVKAAVKIPVWGNGDVFTPEDAERMLRETGCDGVMIARGAKGNPWIFSRTKAYLETGILPPPPSLREIRETILFHARAQAEYRGEHMGILEMRKHVSWYTAGFRGASALRAEINRVNTLGELISLIEKKMPDS